MTADADPSSPPRTGHFVHGGAERLATRLVNAEALPTKISWYRVAPGAHCSHHVHQGKDECWLIVSGRGTARIGEAEHAVYPGDLLYTREGTPHSLFNGEPEDLVFVNFVFPTGTGTISSTEVGEAR
jgi:mannose-6-phosphate isomerase-like protein (cupin superfamily)